MRNCTWNTSRGHRQEILIILTLLKRLEVWGIQLFRNESVYLIFNFNNWYDRSCISFLKIVFSFLTTPKLQIKGEWIHSSRTSVRETVYKWFPVSFRKTKSKTLGFENYAWLSLDSKMAKVPSAVWELIEELKVRAKPAAREEMKALQVSFYWELMLRLKKKILKISSEDFWE